MRSHSRPASGIATSAPREAANSASPSCAFVSDGVMLHGRDPRGPGAEQQPVAEEDEPDREACPRASGEHDLDAEGTVGLEILRSTASAR